MKTTSEIESQLRELKPILAEKFSVERIGYFGSYAMQEQTEDSDLDLLVEFKKPIGWGFFTMEQFLSEQLGLKIDLVTRNALKAQIKEEILKQVRFV